MRATLGCAGPLVCVMVILASELSSADEQSPLGAFSARAVSITPVLGTPIVTFDDNAYPAAEFAYRVEETGTGFAYSLDVFASGDRRETVFDAAFPDSTGVLNLREVTWLVQNNQVSHGQGDDEDRPTISDQIAPPRSEAAAMQAAIWSYTNSIPLNGTTIEDRAVLRRAQELRAEVESRDELPIEINSTAGGFEVSQLGGDLGVVELIVSQRRDSFATNPTQPFCFNLAVDNLSGYVSSGYTNVVDIEGALTGDPLAASSNCADERRDYADHFAADEPDRLTEFAVTGCEDIAAVQCSPDLRTTYIQLPVASTPRTVLVGYFQTLGPGLVFIPRNDASPVMLSTPVEIRDQLAVPIDPPTLGYLRSQFENDVLGLVGTQGWLGWLVLGLGLLLAGFFLRLGAAIAGALSDAIVNIFRRRKPGASP